MSHPEFCKFGEIEDRVVEECDELIKAISKAKRFGYYGYNPYIAKPIINKDKISSEIADVLKVIEEYKIFLQQIEL